MFFSLRQTILKSWFPHCKFPSYIFFCCFASLIYWARPGAWPCDSLECFQPWDDTERIWKFFKLRDSSQVEGILYLFFWPNDRVNIRIRLVLRSIRLLLNIRNNILKVRHVQKSSGSDMVALIWGGRSLANELDPRDPTSEPDGCLPAWSLHSGGTDNKQAKQMNYRSWKVLNRQENRLLW